MTQSPLLNAIAEIQSNTLTTRSWEEAGKLLAVCQQCEKWDRWGCHDIDLRPGPFAVFLCDASRYCERWLKMIATES